MKQSHFRTPRTLEEANIQEWGDPYDDPPRSPWQWHDLVLAAILVAAIIAAVFLSHRLPGGT